MCKEQIAVSLTKAHGCDDPDLEKFLGFTVVISPFCLKTTQIDICIFRGRFLGTHGCNPDMRKFLGFGVVISILHFCPKTSKIEICLLQILSLVPIVLIILIRGNSTKNSQNCNLFFEDPWFS